MAMLFKFNHNFRNSLLKSSTFHSRPSLNRHCSSVRPISNTSFTWDDVIRISEPNYQSSSSSSPNLNGFFDKINACNRNLERETEFIPFLVEDQIVGYIHNGFSDHLRRFQDVFVFIKKNSNGSHFGHHVTLNPILKTPEDRTVAVGEIIQCLGEKVFPGIRNELYPVTSSFGMPTFFSLERAAAPYFGIKAYGVHMNGYIERDGQKYLWLAKRSQTKPTFPGMLDNLVAGGLPHGVACGENVIKECQEEGGIPKSISEKAIPVGAVSYRDIDGPRYKRDVLFCYDLKLHEDFIPSNEDGEVESFKLLPVTHVANVIRRTEFFKQNCSLVIIDFLFRHGYFRPEELGYLQLLQSLNSGDCS